MFYDVSMLILTIVGVVGTVVYSYKMSRTRVYPVGGVRLPPGKRLVAPSIAAQSPVLTEPKPEVTPEFVTAHWVGDVKDYFARNEKPRLAASGSETSKRFSYHVIDHPAMSGEFIFLDDVNVLEGVSWQPSGWRSCPNCGFVQKYEKEARCTQCSYALEQPTMVTGGLEIKKASALQSQVSQHSQALQEMDRRIRELEKESVVKKIAEVAREEEKRQNWVQ